LFIAIILRVLDNLTVPEKQSVGCSSAAKVRGAVQQGHAMLEPPKLRYHAGMSFHQQAGWPGTGMRE
jgi:hypothetical protein